MSMPLLIGAIVIIVAVIAGGYYYVQQASVVKNEAILDQDADRVDDAGGNRYDADADNEQDEVMMEKEDTTVTSETTVESNNKDIEVATTYTGHVLAGTTAPLLVFSQADYNQALAAKKLVVLYFYANWCPTCKAEFPLAEAAFNQLTSDQVVGFRVNFNDSETDQSEKDLAREFGVPYQHTKVFVKNGQSILKSPETWTTQRYLDEIMGNL